MSALTNEIVRQLRADCDWCKPCAGCVKLRIAAADEFEDTDEDALADCGAYLTDGQIDDLRVRRGEVVPGTGAMDVTVESIGG